MANDMHTDGRDIRNGTYDAILPAGKNPTPQEFTPNGADVRSRPSSRTEDPMHEGQLRGRKGPLNAQTGRRLTD